MAKARVTLVNPSEDKKKKKRRKPATKGRKNMAKKKRKAPKRRRRAAPKKRRRNPSPRRTTTPARRRPRRSNPTVTKFGKIDLTKDLKPVAMMQLGGLAAAAAVTRFGDPEIAPASQPFGPGNPYSQTMGTGWTFKNYLIGLVGAWIAGEIGARVWGTPTGQTIYNGGVDLIMKKFLWTQMLSRTKFGPQFFGRADGYATMPPTQAMDGTELGATEGDIQTDDRGNVWLMQGGRWVAMQGLVETGPLGALVETGPLGDTGSGYLPSDTPQGEADWAKYNQSGSSDPYHAAFAM